MDLNKLFGSLGINLGNITKISSGQNDQEQDQPTDSGQTLNSLVDRRSSLRPTSQFTNQPVDSALGLTSARPIPPDPKKQILQQIKWITTLILGKDEDGNPVNSLLKQGFSADGIHLLPVPPVEILFNLLSEYTGVKGDPEREQAIKDFFKNPKDVDGDGKKHYKDVIELWKNPKGKEDDEISSPFTGFGVNDWINFFGLGAFGVNEQDKPVNPRVLGAGFSILLGNEFDPNMKESEFRAKVYEALQNHTGLEITENRKKEINSLLDKLEAGEKVDGYRGDGKTQYQYILNLWKNADWTPYPTKFYA